MRYGKRLLAAVLVMLAAACSDPGDTLRNSVSSRSGLTSVAKVAWKESLDATQPPVRAGRSTYVVRRSGVSAIAPDGKIASTHDFEQPFGTPLTVVSSLVYYGSKQTVVAAEFPEATTVWSTDVGAEVVGALTAVSDLVLVPAGALVALDRETGAQRWRFEANGSFEGAAATRGDLAFAADSDGVVHAINLATGQAHWSFATTSDLTGATPSLAAVQGGDMLFVAGREGTVWGIFADTGRERWRLAAKQEVTSDVAAKGDFAWVATQAGDAFAINARTGQEVWRMDGLSAQVTTPVWAAEMVYLGGDDGKFVVLGAQDGALKWSHQLDAPPVGPPLIDDRRVWFADDRGHLYVVE